MKATGQGSNLEFNVIELAAFLGIGKTTAYKFKNDGVFGDKDAHSYGIDAIKRYVSYLSNRQKTTESLDKVFLQTKIQNLQIEVAKKQSELIPIEMVTSELPEMASALQSFLHDGIDKLCDENDAISNFKAELKGMVDKGLQSFSDHEHIVGILKKNRRENDGDIE